MSTAPVGSFIVIVGPDGAGKTTLAHAIADRLGERMRYFHFLPRPLWRLSDRPGPTGEIVDKNSRIGSKFLGWIRLARNVVKVWLAYWISIRPAIRAGTTVVGDRYLYGYLAQPVPLKYFGPEWLARLALRLAPRPDLVVVLDAPAAVVRGRKPELSVEQIGHEREAWLKVAPNAIVFDSAKPPATIANDVLASLKLPTRLYPPRLGNIVVPESPRRAALAGASLYAPSRPTAQVLHRAARAVISATGTGWLAMAPRIDTPLDASAWAALLDELANAGIGIDRVALYGRTQADRVGFSFLALDNGTPTAFVRVNSDRIDSEVQALCRVANHRPTSFDYPILLSEGWAGRTRYAAFSPVLSGFHRPHRSATVAQIAEQIGTSLEGLSRPPGIPPHWRPMHGDFTPWNLRRQGIRVVLIDWESAGWGPPGADATLYAATASALRIKAPSVCPTLEGAQYWLALQRRGSTRRDNRLYDRVVSQLRGVLEGNV